MTPHTSGPWEIEEDVADRYIVGSDGETIAIMAEDVMDEGQRMADARLIAAAPDLYAACRAYLFAKTHQDYVNAQITMRSAVIRAEGGAS